MSRVGKKPVEIPAGVKANIQAGLVTIEGPKGKLDYQPASFVSVKVEENRIVLDSPISNNTQKAAYGSARAHLANMIHGVTKGWKRALELNGVGFSASMQGKKIKLVVGYSHDVLLEIPAGLNCKVEKTSIEIEGNDKQVVGDFAASIRRVCPPEPYLGKGIKYSDEVVRRKAGKTGKK